jgi:multiple antibiotic resistance protein
MTLTADQLLLLFTALVSLFSPLANIGPFTALVGHFSREDQRKIARGVLVNAVVVTLIFVWGGELLFNLLGVNPASLTVTGGIALFLAGMPMMLTGAKEPEGEDEAIEEAKKKKGDQDWRSMVVVPMTFPMSVDGTTAAYVVSATAFAQNAVDLLALSGAVVLFCIVVWLTHLFSPLIGRAVGPGGRDILTRVGGIVLVAIAVQLLASGLKGLFPALGG